MRWTVDRYQEAINHGIIREDDHVELLFGTIIERMPANEPHVACIETMREYFTERYFKQYALRSESAIRLPSESLPQPDFVIADYHHNHYSTGFPVPDQIHLVVEVADSSLPIDRSTKTEAYALAGIREYWIVNLKERQLEVHLEPNVNGGNYGEVIHYPEGRVANSPFVGTVDVADLLP